MAKLQDKVALITGGARGQGAAEAILFAREGAHVFICDLLDAEGNDLAQEISAQGGSAAFIRLDVSSAEHWSAAIRDVKVQTGRLDILINNAGTNVRHQLSDTTREEWDKIIDVNLTGQMLGMQACMPMMKAQRKGSIVNIGSTAAIMGHPVAGYSTSKWGVRGLTKAAAMELAPFNIRVNAMHPGVVATPMMDPSTKVFAELVNMTPLGRAAAPEELAAAALFLASDDSSFITGIDLAVDGGFSEFGAYGEIWRRLNA